MLHIRNKNDELNDFIASMSRSHRGNLWKPLDDGRTISIFPNPSRGGFSWCIADKGELEYSERPFPTEEQAAQDLMFEIGR